jgi:hypothetical protein
MVALGCSAERLDGLTNPHISKEVRSVSIAPDGYLPALGGSRGPWLSRRMGSHASEMITLEQVARQLTSCDFIFGCTDDNAGRLVLSRIPTYLLTPVIDCGVLLTSDQTGTLIGIDGRMTISAAGHPCLVCRGRVDLARASAKLLTPEERIRRQDEGYAPALGGTEPAVIAFTTLVSATAVTELLERLIGYGPQPRPSEILLRIDERGISTNVGQSREGHYCHPAAGKIGRGPSDPYLDQTWPT